MEHEEEKKEREPDYILHNILGHQIGLLYLIRTLVIYVGGIASFLIIAPHIPFSTEEGINNIAIRGADLMVPLCIFLGFYSLGWVIFYYLGRSILYFKRLIMGAR